VTPLENVVRLADQNAYGAFATRFRAHDQRRFVESFDGRTFSYSDLERITAQMAGLLVQHGVRKADRVAGLLEKSPESIMLYFAVARAGAVYMPLSTALRPPEIDYLLGDARPRVAVCAPEHEALIERVSVDCGIERIFTIDATGCGSFRAEFEGRDADFDPVPCTGHDANAIVYTSGTTGQPKGAVITNGLAVWNGVTLGEWWEFGPDDVLLHANPPAYSIFGTTTPVTACGASMVLLPKFEADAVIRLLPRATVFAGVPTYYGRLLEREDFTAQTCAHMRLFVTGSAPMRPDIFEAFRQRTGHTLLDRYGLTETLLVTSNPVGGERCAGDSGVPLPGVELRIVDEAGAPVADGEIGAIEVRQPYMFDGYWKAPDKTQRAFRSDGFFITGDFGLRAARGHVVVLGRGTELIITGGLNVYPKEIENHINGFDNVSESAVIGVPHADFGEGVVAVVQVHDRAAGLDVDGLVHRLRSELASYKVPKQVVVADELPRNALGKIQKNVLKAQYADVFRAGKELS
jgi:malonyl-CoA/methylmalonyl-CoA synthetase